MPIPTNQPGPMRALLLPALICALSACDPAATPSDGSAPPSGDVAQPYLVAASTPAFVLGGPEVTGATQFSRIGEAAVLADGSFWVVDARTRELRSFSEDGTHLRTIGGSGDGPGEFESVELLGLISGDSLVVLDDGAARLTVLAADGTFGRTGPFLSQSQLPLVQPTIFPDGRIGALESNPIRLGVVEPGYVTPDSSALLVIHPDLRVDTVGWGRSAQMIYRGTEGTSGSLAFTAMAGMTTSEGRLLRSDAESFSISVFENGDIVDRFEAPREARTVDQEMTDALLDAISTRRSESSEARARAFIEDTSEHLPVIAPGYDRLIRAHSGEIWAKIWTPFSDWFFGGYPNALSDTWDVYASDGAYLGPVEAPPGIEVLAIGPDYMLAMRMDDLAVPYLEKYDLREP